MTYVDTRYSSRTERTQNRYQKDYEDQLARLNEQQALLQAQSVFTTANAQAAAQNTQAATSEGCTDGKDDGKVGFFEGLGSVLKGAFDGVVNGVKGMFTDENGNFSLGNTLKSAAMIGACFIPGVGPFIGAGLCAVGVVKGATGLVQNISAAANAKTDAEAKAALEGCGASGLTTVVSAVGLKGSVGAIAKGAGVEGAASNGVIKNVKAMATKGEGTGLMGGAKNFVSNCKTSAGFGAEGMYTKAFNSAAEGASGKITATLKGAKGVAKEMGSGAIENMSAFKTAASEKLKNSKVGKTASKLKGNGGKTTKTVDAEIKAEAQARTTAAEQIKQAQNAQDALIDVQTNPSGMSTSEAAELAKQFAEKDIYGETPSSVKLTAEQRFEIASEKIQTAKKSFSNHWEAGSTRGLTGVASGKTIVATAGSMAAQNGSDQANLNTLKEQYKSAYSQYTKSASTPITFHTNPYSRLSSEEINDIYSAIDVNSRNIREAAM